MRAIWTLLFAAGALAQIGPARIGCFVDARQRLRFVDGVAGSFIISAPQRENVLAAACFERLTLVKLEASLEVNGTLFAAPPGSARFHAGGVVQYLETGEWVRAREGGLEPAEPRETPEPAVQEQSAIVVDGRRVELAARPVAVERLGPGWLRILLADERHMALSLDGLRLYRLPEVTP